MKTRVDDELLRTAAGQRMLISRRQCYEAGLSLRQVRHRLDRGSWAAVRPNVFTVDGSALEDWEGELLAALLSVEGAIASHGTALWLHGVRCLECPEVLDLLVGHGNRATVAGAIVHQTRWLPARDRTEVDGIPTTTCARAIVDLYATLSLAARIRVVDEAIYAKATTRAQLRLLARSDHGGRAGVPALLRLVDHRATERFRSWLEAEAARIWRAAGLPEPQWNVVLRDERGRIGEVDAVFPGGLVVVELDGPRFHSSPSQRRKDKARDRRISLTGRIVLRYDWEDVAVKPPALMIDEIRRALQATAATAR